MSPVFENAEAFYALELVGREPEGFLTIEQARSSIERTLRLEKKLASALEHAEEAVREGGTLEQIAARLEAEIEEPPTFSRSDFVPGLGRQNAIIGTAFGLATGQLSGVVEANGPRFRAGVGRPNSRGQHRVGGAESGPARDGGGNARPAATGAVDHRFCANALVSWTGAGKSSAPRKRLRTRPSFR